MLRLLFYILVGLTLKASMSASDVFWPGWLGPNRDGRADYFESPGSWPNDLRKDWSISVGEGSSMPVVADGRIYQHARQGGNEVVLCLDLETGDVLWRKTHPVSYRIHSFGESHGDGPQSNPTVDGGRLFTLSVTGVLSAWATESGELLWRHGYADRFRSTFPRWGHSTSPLVDGDQVVVHVGGEESGMLVAYDVATGDILWLGPPRMGDYATFLTFAGHIIALRDDATLEILASGEDEYLRVATYKVADSATWTAPVLLMDGILVKDRTKLYKWSF